MLGQPTGATFDIVRMLGLSANGGKADEVFEICQPTPTSWVKALR